MTPPDRECVEAPATLEVVGAEPVVEGEFAVEVEFMVVEGHIVNELLWVANQSVIICPRKVPLGKVERYLVIALYKQTY